MPHNDHAGALWSIALARQLAHRVYQHAMLYPLIFAVFLFAGCHEQPSAPDAATSGWALTIAESGDEMPLVIKTSEDLLWDALCLTDGDRITLALEWWNGEAWVRIAVSPWGNECLYAGVWRRNASYRIAAYSLESIDVGPLVLRGSGRLPTTLVVHQSP